MSFLQGLFKPNVQKLESRSNVWGLIRALRYKEAKVRQDAAEALGRLKDHSTVAALLHAAIKDENMDVRRVAAKALEQIGAPAVELLIAALKDNDENVRRVAAKALGQIGAPAVEPLLATLKDKNTDVRRAAAEAP